MSTQKSPLYKALGILFSLIVLAGGAAKLYRGVSNLKGAKLDPKVSELLEKSDQYIAEANSQSVATSTEFEVLLSDFDKLGIEKFRSEKRESCAQLTKQFEAIGQRLHEASTLLVEATKLGTNQKTTEFLLARSASYELLVKVNAQNIDIIRVTQDESIVDMNTVVEKVLSIAKKRDEDQKAANEATAASDAIL